MEPTPDREENMLAEALESAEARAAYRIESTDDEIVVRIRRGTVREEWIFRLLALLEPELTEEEERELADGSDRPGREKLRHRAGTAGSARQQALDALQQLPAEASVDDMMEKLYFMSKVQRGLQQIEAGQVVSHEEAKRRFGR